MRGNLLVSRFLDTVGDGSGTKNAIGDYSGAAEEFFCQPAAHDKIFIARIIVSIEDAQNMRAEHYGTLGAALTNGITLTEQDGSGTIVDFTDGVPIKANAQWGSLCYDVDVKTWGAGNELLLVRYTFARFGPGGIFLDGANSEKIVVTVNDDLTGLVGHYFMIQGYNVGIDG